MKRFAILAVVVLMAFSCSKPQEQGEQPPSPPKPMAVMTIVTEGSAPIVSKEDYVNAVYSLSVGEDILVKDAVGKIRGRGNSSWWNTDKKSYRIKMDKKTSFLDRPADKSWALVANSFDKSMIRNSLSYHIGAEYSRLAYTTPSDYVELYLNGEYQGLYILVDHPKTADYRVAADFLMEIDARAEEGDVQFRTPGLLSPVVVKDPDDIKTGDEDYNYINAFVNSAEAALFADNYTDARTGWRSFFDAEALVDWYLINEISKNNDAILFTSCYMNHSRGGKLAMGPLWDFDGAWGNTTYNDNFKPEGIWIGQSSWYARLLTDPSFVSEVKERFAYYYSHKDEFLEYVDNLAAYLEPYVIKDDARWHTFGNTQTWNSVVEFDNYSAYVDWFKDWMNKRFEWLKNYYDTI